MPRIREFRWDSWALWTAAQIYRDQPACVAVDTETSGLEFYDEPFCATLSWRAPDGALKHGYIDLEHEHGLEARRAMLGATLRRVPTWVFHNAKFDLQKLLLIGAIYWSDVDRARLEDTQTLFHLLDENSPKGLKALAVSVLGVDDTIEVTVKSGKNAGTTKRVPKEAHILNRALRQFGLRKKDGYHLLPRHVLIPYAIKDTDFTLELYEVLRPALERRDPALLGLYEREVKLKKVLLHMMESGLRLDLPYLEATASEYGQRAMEDWTRIVALTGNADLNPNSPPQLKNAFAERGVFLDSTAVDVLEKLDDELARAILEYRSDTKMHKTYLQGLLAMQRDGLVHPWFNEDGARSGRMSSGKVNE